MRFWKMNGAGNDFIIINNMEEKLPRSVFPELARAVCHRHLSVGADGLMVVERATTAADFRMLFYNSDGSEGEMCGNGARCICRYGYENRLSGETQTVETLSGIVTGQRIDKRNYRIRLTDPSVIRLDCPVEACGKHFPCAYIELGKPGLPHAVVPMDGLGVKSFEELREAGRSIRHCKEFPKGANVNFYCIESEDELTLRTFERGVEDFTYACGTGAGSAVLALTLMGKVSGRNVALRNPGGTLCVSVERTGERIDAILLTGPTNVVCMGELSDEELPV